MRPLGFTGVQSIVRGSMVAYIVSVDDVMVIAFRGTDDAGDWIANLNVLPRSTPHGDIHDGFAAAYDTLRSAIVGAVKRDTPKHLWITGHSLGGALALVCAYDLIENEKVTPQGLITFGQPMVASEKLARYLDGALLGRFAHVVNEHDIVPRIPPFFAHCGSLVWFIDGEVRWSVPKRQVYATVANKLPTAGEKGEIEPVSQPEFERIKAQARSRKAIPKSRPDEPQKYEGNLPFLSDHPIGIYIDKVRELFKMFGQEP